MAASVGRSEARAGRIRIARHTSEALFAKTFQHQMGFFNGPYMQSFITQVNLPRPGMNHSVDFIIFKYILRELACSPWRTFVEVAILS